jgi:hypothetical protein
MIVQGTSIPRDAAHINRAARLLAAKIADSLRSKCFESLANSSTRFCGRGMNPSPFSSTYFSCRFASKIAQPSSNLRATFVQPSRNFIPRHLLSRQLSTRFKRQPVPPRTTATKGNGGTRRAIFLASALRQKRFNDSIVWRVTRGTRRSDFHAWRGQFVSTAGRGRT